MNMGSSGGGASGGAVSSGFDIAGGMSQAMASRKASKEMKKSMKKAMYLWQLEKDRQIAAYKPWTETGREAAKTLWEKIQAGPGEYEESPYYNFLLEEGTKGLERGAAARGRQFSGAQAKALTRYGEELGKTDYNTWLTNWYKSLVPIESVSNKGLAAETALSGGQMQITNAISDLVQSMGAVDAAQWMNLGNLMASSQRQTGNQIGSGIAGMGLGGGQMNLGSIPNFNTNALTQPLQYRPYTGF